jgi:hypothetical protein
VLVTAMVALTEDDSTIRAPRSIRATAACVMNSWPPTLIPNTRS